MNSHGTEATITCVDQKVFGDGTHETTQLVLDALYQQNPNGKTVLDMGTGSGIQSIFAKKLGASEVMAVDILPECIYEARKNFRRNNVDVKSRLNIYNEYMDDKYDITVANLPVGGLREYLPMAKKTMAKGGVLIFSYPKREQFSALNIDGFEVIKRIEGIDYDAYVIRSRE